MVTLVNRAKMTTATTGTGTITLGSAVGGYQTFAAAGVANADQVRYVIEDGAAWEIGLGTYTATGTTLSRSLTESSTGSLLNLSGEAVVFVSAAGADIQQPPSEGAFVDGDKTKLDGIEAGADVTDTANVTAAGALMDSEVTNLADVKAFDPADYATAAQGSLADTATQPGDNISTLTNDAGYTTNVGDITGVTAGSGITGGGTSGTVTVSHADTSSQSSVNNSGNTVIQDVTLDTYGHVTGLASTTLSIPAAANNATVTISAGSQLTGGGAFTTDQSFNETITINHGDTSTLSGTYGSTSDGTKIDTITVDANGHVTAVTTGNTGDITGVTAGTGLSGGGTSGSVTLNGVTQTTAAWEAGTSTTEGVVSPAKIKAAIEANGSESPVKAWVNFNGTGTVAIRESGNVSSITDNGTGDYTVNFATALVDVNYAVVGSGRDTVGGSSVAASVAGSTVGSLASVKSTGSVRIRSITTSDALRDSDDVSVIVTR